MLSLTLSDSEQYFKNYKKKRHLTEYLNCILQIRTMVSHGGHDLLGYAKAFL